MSDLILHGIAASTYVRTCRMALSEKGIDYQLDPAIPQSEEQLARQPWGQVPALTHGDFKLYETLAISRYIDEAFAGNGTALQPADVAERALMNQWISVLISYAYKPMIVDIVLQRIVAPMRGATPDEEQIAAGVPGAQKALGEFNRGLANADYLAGNRLSLADMFLLPVINYLGMTPEGKNLLTGAPNVSRWQQAMEALDCARVLQES